MRLTRVKAAWLLGLLRDLRVETYFNPYWFISEVKARSVRVIRVAMDTRCLISGLRVFNYEGLADAILLSGRVDISRTHCTTRVEVRFCARVVVGVLNRESDRIVTDRTRVREKEEKERGRIVRREV